MSASGSRGHTADQARSQPSKEPRRRQDIVLSASASIHLALSRHVAEPALSFCRQRAVRHVLMLLSVNTYAA
jgi:hypothetical protein